MCRDNAKNVRAFTRADILYWKSYETTKVYRARVDAVILRVLRKDFIDFNRTFSGRSRRLSCTIALVSSFVQLVYLCRSIILYLCE